MITLALRVWWILGDRRNAAAVAVLGRLGFVPAVQFLGIGVGAVAVAVHPALRGGTDLGGIEPTGQPAGPYLISRINFPTSIQKYNEIQKQLF